MRLRHIIIGLGLLTTAQALPMWGQDIKDTDLQSPSPYETALQNVQRGRTEEAKNYLSHLSKRDAHLFPNRYLSVLVHLHQLDIEEATKELTALESIRKKSDEESIMIDQTLTRIENAKRMLSNTFIIPIINIQEGTMKQIEADLHQHTQHIGTVSASSYISTDHTMKWCVLKSESGQPAIGILHRMEDGTWDEDGMKTIEINGLSEDGEIAYPFLMDDGMTLYFAYRGPETLGGYDLYVTRYDRRSGTLLVPQQLPMPYNTTADDYAYILDNQSKSGYIVTAHGTQEGEAKLITILPEEQKKVDSDDPKLLSQIALRDSVIRVDHSVDQELMKTPHVSDTSPAILFIGKTAIHSDQDLKSDTAKASFRRMRGLMEQLGHVEERLYTLRHEYHLNASSETIRKKIIEMEEKRLSLGQEIRVLRNEVIRQENKRD